MREPRRLLLADDGSGASEAARHAALELAAAWEAELHVVNSGGDSLDAVGILTAQSDVTPVLHHRDGAPARAVLECATEIGAELIVLGSRPLPLDRILGGSVSREVVTSSRIPVLVVRTGSWPPQRIVIGHDGSDEAMAAGELAAEIGREHDATALLVDVLPELADLDDEPELLALRRRLSGSEERRLSDRAALLATALGHAPETSIRFDNPVVVMREVALEEAAHERVLVAVGSSGRSTHQRLMGWSVSDTVVGLRQGSVLVVPRSSIAG